MFTLFHLAFLFIGTANGMTIKNHWLLPLLPTDCGCEIGQAFSGPVYFIANPVCCNGQDFGNPCEASCAGFESEDCSEGFCEFFDCVAAAFPVCCGGETYGDACAAKRDGFEYWECVFGSC
eukprot:TRINITY_DN461_c0_g1_i1.p2 TRINITY_DN461_c0_g1~~TRINITY_DN461_c0_g1_i1.p2  ORF type:complete len:121 (-),score=13.19 TRINITY_DN461_c0_g1_i1:248-610(-)